MIQRIVSVAAGLAFACAVFLVASFLVAVAVTAGLLLWAWAWWRGRHERRRIIEGEYRIIDVR